MPCPRTQRRMNGSEPATSRSNVKHPITKPWHPGAIGGITMRLTKFSFSCSNLRTKRWRDFNLCSTFEPRDISNNVVCATSEASDQPARMTSKASDQPAHTHSLIRVFATCSRLIILLVLCYLMNIIWIFTLKRRLRRFF